MHYIYIRVEFDLLKNDQVNSFYENCWKMQKKMYLYHPCSISNLYYIDEHVGSIKKKHIVELERSSYCTKLLNLCTFVKSVI